MFLRLDSLSVGSITLVFYVGSSTLGIATNAHILGLVVGAPSNRTSSTSPTSIFGPYDQLALDTDL